jgi:hypothetical protein
MCGRWAALWLLLDRPFAGSWAGREPMLRARRDGDGDGDLGAGDLGAGVLGAEEDLGASAGGSSSTAGGTCCGVWARDDTLDTLDTWGTVLTVLAVLIVLTVVTGDLAGKRQ